MRGEDTGRRGERASLAWLETLSVRGVLGPFRQAPAQQGGRDNHAAPDPVQRDGGMAEMRQTEEGWVGKWWKVEDGDKEKTGSESR